MPVAAVIAVEDLIAEIVVATLEAEAVGISFVCR